MKGLQRIVVLEADLDRKSYVKRWANGEVESTREVRQKQATLDEDAFSGESEESMEDLVEEEPLVLKKMKKMMGRKKMRRTRVTLIRAMMMTTTSPSRRHSGTRTP